MKYIDVEKLKAEIERYKQGAAIARFDNAGENADYFQGKVDLCDDLTHIIEFLQQEPPVTKEPISHLEHWLAFFGCPEENIEKCATQISQGYGAIRYLEGVQRGAEAVNELAQQEQPEVDLEREIIKYKVPFSDDREYLNEQTLDAIARHFYELGLNARKEETK